MYIGLRHDTRAAIDLDCPEAIKVAERFHTSPKTQNGLSCVSALWWGAVLRRYASSE
jgi:hypothetical protein